MSRQRSPGAGARTRTRLLLLFLLTFSVVLAAVGSATWWWLSARLQAEAEARAHSIGLLAGFLGSEFARGRIEDLTGYRIHDAASDQHPSPGTVLVRDAQGRHIAVHWQGEAYERTRDDLRLGLLIATGLALALAAGLAWVIAARIARPLEQLAAATRRIGGGDLERLVPPVGHGEVAALAADLESMRSQLQVMTGRIRETERLAALGSFAAGIAHEVRNPLAAIRLSLQVLARRGRDDPQLGMALDEIDRLDLVLDELLSYGRGLQLTVAPCRVAEEVSTVLRLLARQAQHAGVELVQDAALVAPSATVLADGRRLRQVLLNLVLNAIQAQHGQDVEGVVLVRVLSDGFAVEDQGPGVATELAARLFQPFTGERRDGSGLGLHLARNIVEAHGATLAYEPRPGGGARFVVSGLAPAPGPA